MTSVKVTQAIAGAIVTEGGEHIVSDLKVWAAGVKGAFPGDGDGLEVNRINQLVVRPTLQTTLDDRIFAVGDCCSCTVGGSDRPVPPRAQAAHQMAATVFANLDRLASGKPLVEFVYKDHGSLVSLSRFSTVGSLMGNLIGGRMAIEGRWRASPIITLLDAPDCRSRLGTGSRRSALGRLKRNHSSAPQAALIDDPYFGLR